MRRTVLLFGLGFVLAVALGCEDKGNETTKKLPEGELWTLAQKEKDIDTYERYVSDYPSGGHAQEAKQMLRDQWDKKVQSLTADDIAKLTAVIETNQGVIKFSFYPEVAPEHCKNFIKLAQSHFYDGLIFHRVIKGFMIQGGCPDGTGKGGPGYQVDAEFGERRHLEGTVAMARSNDPDSAGSQFYICLAPQAGLDRNYTVFGQTTEGIDTVHAIGKTRTGRGDKPVEPQIMNKVYIEGL